MKVKRIGNREAKAIDTIGIGETFFYDGEVHMVINTPKDTNKIHSDSYTWAVNLQGNAAYGIRNDVLVHPINAEIVCS